MHTPVLFRDRPRPFQVVLGGVVPLLFGAVVGIVLGISSGGYWGLSALAAIGGVLAGFEHRDGWGGADRGLVGGALFGLGVLVAHAIAGTHAKVSLGGFPPLLVVIDAIVGMFLGALGGRIARALRERTGQPVLDEEPLAAEPLVEESLVD
jgi:NO-binding membrane sensor protein with MHYT domain